MLAVTTNRYSVVFGAQLSCKTFYRTDIYSEEAIPLLDRHVKLTLFIFLSVDKRAFHAVTCPPRSKVSASISVVRSVKRLATLSTLRLGQLGHLLRLIFLKQEL